MFVARDTAKNAGQLAWQMARGEVRAASIAWTTGEELAKTAQAQQLQAELAQPQPQPQSPARAMAVEVPR